MPESRTYPNMTTPLVGTMHILFPKPTYRHFQRNFCAPRAGAPSVSWRLGPLGAAGSATAGHVCSVTMTDWDHPERSHPPPMWAATLRRKLDKDCRTQLRTFVPKSPQLAHCQRAPD